MFGLRHVELYEEDCTVLMPQMPGGLVDAIVCDPPYGLGFMGKAWDSDFKPGDSPMRRSVQLDAVNAGAARQGGRQRAGLDYQRRMARDSRAFQEWVATWAIASLCVLKPGGHLLAFGGSRTYHRLACGLEDAGFEIRDCLSWLYGSGFPKSLDVSKAIDKRLGAERAVTRAAARPLDPGEVVSFDQRSSGDRERRDEPITAAAAALQGLGTALKPAWEPIILARKPLVGTVAANFLQHGTGALAIDPCRIAAVGGSPAAERRKGGTYHLSTAEEGRAKEAAGRLANRTTPERYREQRAGESIGRWPANVVLDEEAARLLDEQTADLSSHGGGTSSTGFWQRDDRRQPIPAGDSGGASRFFYTAKADSGERHYAGKNTHPTVKPVDLMRWLCRLVTPKGGLILDPFMGSGSTGVAALAEGFRFIGIEREAEYVEIARKRIAGPLFAQDGAGA